MAKTRSPAAPCLTMGQVTAAAAAGRAADACTAGTAEATVAALAIPVVAKTPAIAIPPARMPRDAVRHTLNMIPLGPKRSMWPFAAHWPENKNFPASERYVGAGRIVNGDADIR
jgi:hypothetical protein